MRVLVTGATGFLGTHLCDSLAARGDTLALIWRDAVKPSFFVERMVGWKRFTAVQGNILDEGLVERVIAEYGIEAVVHLAAQAQVSVAASDPTETFRVNAMGTLAVLEACRRQKVERVIVASTDKVYGETGRPYVEAMPLSERNPYGASKVCADIIAQTYQQHYGMNVAITRCGNLYGPGHHNWSTLIPSAIRAFYRMEPIVVRFGGRAIRDFLFVDDAVDAYLALLNNRCNEPFNLSGGEPRTILDTVKKIAAVMGESEKLIQVTEEGTGEIVSQALNCQLAEACFGWKPRVSFNDGIRHTVKWYRNYFEHGGEL